MNKHLVFITGMYKTVQQAVKESVTDLQALVFPALEDTLREGAICRRWDHCQVFDELLMYKEFERDELILVTLEKVPCVVVEQWHIGNLAHARLRSPSVAERYETKLSQHLSRFSGVSLEEFYVSTDVDELSETYDLTRDFYRSWLKELSALNEQFKVSCQTIDGEALPQSVRQRVLYLLNQLITN